MQSPLSLISTSISIEGNIGSGKSSILSQVMSGETEWLRQSEITPIHEPVNNWSSYRDSAGASILEKFYSDMPRYAFPFQMLAYFTRYGIYRSAEGRMLLTERSLDTDRHIFAQMQADIGNIDEISFQIYKSWFHFHARGIEVAGRIYMRTPPELCYERIHQRARKGEEGISMELLRGYHEYHERWLMGGREEVPLLVLDGREPLESHIPAIKEFVNTIANGRHEGASG